jgi:hypothetical protein
MFLDVFDYYIIPMILIWKYVLKKVEKGCNYIIKVLIKGYTT